MYKTAILALVILAAAGLSLQAEDTDRTFTQKAETETLFSRSSADDVFLSGFAGLRTQISRIGDSCVTLPGFRAGLIVDETVIGVSGYALAYPTRRSSLSGESYSGTDPYMRLGYGGFLLEHHFMPKRLMNFSAGVTLGGGNYTFTDRKHGGDGSGERSVHGRNFFYVEPELAAYINISGFCRLGAGVSYRYFHHAGRVEFTNRDFRNAGVTLMADIGWF
jgi:hypothetical protein